MLGFFEECHREFGDVAYFRAGNRRSVLVSHPDDIERLLVTENRRFEKNYGLRLLKPLLGNGLLLNERGPWLRQRRLIQPAFSKLRVESYVPAMVQRIDAMLRQWRAGETRDLHAEMMQLTMAIAGKTLLDVELGEQFDEVSGCLEATMHDFLTRFRSPVPLPMWLPTPLNWRLKRTVRRLDAILQRLIDERRAEATERGDFLSLLIAARDEDDGRGMSDRQLRDEVMTMFLAGHETTANGLAWTWHLLGPRAELQERIHAEVAAVCGERLPTAAELPRLEFCERVIRESLRLYPPAFVVGRQAAEDFHLGEHFIPARTNVLASQWVVQRDPRWFDRPDEFLPDRWADGLAARLPKYAYFPFGGGPRVCIGNVFALSEATLILALVVQRFRFAPAGNEPVLPKPAVTLRPGRPIEMHLQRW